MALSDLVAQRSGEIVKEKRRLLRDGDQALLRCRQQLLWQKLPHGMVGRRCVRMVAGRAVDGIGPLPAELEKAHIPGITPHL